jgi:hypothetical protein
LSTIDGKVVQAPAGIPGFDTTEVLNAVSAKNYYNKGHRFCVRYIGRSADKSIYVDITQPEAQIIELLALISASAKLP